MLPLAIKLKGGPIKSHENKDKHSNWHDATSVPLNESFFFAYQSQNSSYENINERINDFQSNWKMFSVEDKKLLRPLIEKILTLQNKYSNERMNIDGTVSDYIYMMY